MRHSINEFIGIVYSYYPRGLLSNDPQYNETEEYRRLVAVRRQAGANNEPWRAMLQRLSNKFPDNSVQNRSLHLPTGSWDACYSACLYLAPAPGEYHHTVGFLVSFLVPYYVIYSSRTVNNHEKMDEMKANPAAPNQYASVSLADFPDTMFILPACIVKPEFIEPDPPIQAYRNNISFSLSSDEQPYGEWIARDIEATWTGYERMPPEVGNVIIPDVSTNGKLLGEATLFNCLFSDVE